jgi:hypothetical protein
VLEVNMRVKWELTGMAGLVGFAKRCEQITKALVKIVYPHIFRSRIISCI